MAKFDYIHRVLFHQSYHSSGRLIKAPVQVLRYKTRERERDRERWETDHVHVVKFIIVQGKSFKYVKWGYISTTTRKKLMFEPSFVGPWIIKLVFLAVAHRFLAKDTCLNIEYL